MTRRTLVLLAVLAGSQWLGLGGGLAQEADAKPHIPLQKTIGQVTPTGPVPSLFVLNSAGAKLEGNKLTMTGVAPNSIVFADRPVRAAGHVTTEQFIMQWDEGKDNFIKDPPNATISVLGGDGSKVEDAVVTLMKPLLEAGNLTFEVAVLEGSLSGGRDPPRCLLIVAAASVVAALAAVAMASAVAALVVVTAASAASTVTSPVAIDWLATIDASLTIDTRSTDTASIATGTRPSIMARGMPAGWQRVPRSARPWQLLTIGRTLTLTGNADIIRIRLATRARTGG